MGTRRHPHPRRRWAGLLALALAAGVGAPLGLAAPAVAAAAAGPAAAPVAVPGRAAQAPGASGDVTDIAPAALPRVRPVAAEIRRERLAAVAAAAGGTAPDAVGAQEVTSPDPLKLVAVTWTGAPPDVVELRSRLRDGRLGDWTRIDPVDTERDGHVAPPTGTEPVWVDDARTVQVRATTAGRPVTDRVALTSIDPGTAGNDAAIATTRAAGTTGSPASPRVVTRAQWGADERLMTWRPEYTPTVRAVTVHHTAGTNNYTAAQSAAIIRGIYSYHAQTLGWGDIGYNALVDRFGTVFEGRAGGLDRAVVAAHAGGFNRQTFGIGMMGTFSTVAPPAATVEAVSQLSAWKLGGLYRDPRGTVTLTSAGGGTSKYAAGRAVTLPTIFAHRDVGATECPGNVGVASMPAIRNRVAALVGNLGANPIRAAWLGRAVQLGEPAVVEAPTARSGRTTRFSTGGSVYWSAPTAAHSVIGAINARYDGFGAAAGFVGLPVTDELPTPDGRGRFNHFQVGSIYWTPTTGAHPVLGAIRDRWASLGWERSTYGYPRTGEYAVPGGQRQDFERGSLTWTAATGVVR